MFDPRFKITNPILKSVGVIEAAKEIIENAPLIPAWEAKFREDAMVRTIHHGTHIEGNDLTLDQAKQVINGQEITAKERDIQEVINYRQVVDYMDKLGQEKEKYHLKTLKKLHQLTCEKILDSDKCGHFRTVRVVIKDSESGEVTFTPPPAVAVPVQTKSFFNWLNDEEGKQTHSILRAGITHYELVRIHPFLDGNGRVARAMATLVLFREGYDIKRFFSLEEYYDNDADSYYRALQSVDRNQGDMTLWLEYFTKVLAIELTRIKEKVKKLSFDLKVKNRTGKQIALSERQIKLVEYLENNKKMSMSEASKLIPDVSEDTILRDLNDLRKKGIVKRKGKTKGVRYMLKEVV